jgi:hypothetical protein
MIKIEIPENAYIPTVGNKKKTELAKDLGVSQVTIYSYHSIALKCIADFEEDYPEEEGKRVTNVNMTPYQTWVIRLLIGYGQVMGTRRLAYYLENDTAFEAQFSKDAFQLTFAPKVIAELVEA